MINVSIYLINTHKVKMISHLTSQNLKKSRSSLTFLQFYVYSFLYTLFVQHHMSHFFRKLIAFLLAFQLFFPVPQGIVLAQELAEDGPAVVEEVVEEAQIIDDFSENAEGVAEPATDVVEETMADPVLEEMEVEQEPVSEVIEEISKDPISEEEVQVPEQDASSDEGNVSDESEDLPAEEEVGQSDERDDVQNDVIDQNVQSKDLPQEEVPEMNLEQALLLFDEALLKGLFSRDDRAGMVSFLKSISASEEMIQDILTRFPLRNERSLKRSTLPISSGIIPSHLLKKPTKRFFSGFSTESVQPEVPVEYVSDRVIVKVSSRAVAEQWIAEADQQNVEVLLLLDESQPLLRVDALDGRSTIDLLQQYVQDPAVVYQEPDYVYRTEAIPNDSTQSFQWHHFNTGGSYAGFSGTAGEDLQSRDAWDIFTGNGNIIVAVIDTGVMYTHPDLQNRMWDGSAACVDHNGTTIPGGCPHHGYDYFDLDNDPIDETNHGTLVAGSTAAHGNNSVGVAGVNWNGKIMALKTGTADSTALSGSAIVNSIYFAVRNGAKVLNMSFTSSGESTSVTNAINFARSQGVLAIAAAGNNSLNLDVPGQNAYPCETNLDNIVCVAATNLQGTLQFLGSSSTSNYGATSVDLAAPGTHVLSTAPVQTDLYTNAFENGASDVSQFILSGGSGWGLKDTGTNKLLTSHTSGAYTNNESTFAEINQSFNLSGYKSGTLLFEMSCVTDNAFDGSGFPVDGVAVDFSHDGGSSYQEAVSFNGSMTTQRGQFDVGPNGLPLITIGLSEEDFVSQFRFRFHFFSNATTTGAGCDIDELKLRVTNGSTYLYASGTSFAAPLTAGLASLIWEYKPALSYQQVIQNLLNGGESLPALTSTTISGKRINSYRSLALLTDPAVVNLRGFLSSGGTEFSSGAAIATAGPFFSWTAPTAQGILSGYSYAVDGVPDAVVDTTSLSVALSGLSQGAHTFQVFGVNDMGVTGTVVTFTFTVDTVVPSAPSSVLMNGNNFVNASNVAASTLTGTASEAGTLQFSISDGVNPNVTGSQAVSAGAFSIGSINLSSLNQGNLSLSLTLTDAAGNVSPAANGTLINDTQVAVPSNLRLNAGNPIVIVTPATVALSFETVEAGSASYTISNGAQADLTGTVVVSGAGTSSTTINHSSLNDAVLNISLVFTDAAGNQASAATTNLTKDTQISAATGVALNGGNGVNAASQANSSLVFTTTETGSATYTITDGSAPNVSGSVTVIGSGTTTVSGLNVSGLDDGTLNISVVFTDAVGNVATAGTATSSKDVTVSPAANVQLNGGATILAAVQMAVDLTFTTTEAGSATYIITDGSAPNVSGTVTVTGAGTTTVADLDVSGLDDGTLNISVVFSDNVLNQAAAGTGSVLKDSSVSTPTNVQLNGGVTISSLNQTSVALTFVTTEAGSATYVITDGSAPNVSGSVTVTGAGTTTVSGLNVSGLDDGTLNLSVVFTDSSGNVSGAGTGSVAKDTAVSAAAGVTLNAGVGVNANTAGNSSLRFTTTEAGSASYVISNGVNPNVSGSVTVTGAGTTTVSNLNLSGFTDGTLNLSVMFTDSVGNAATAGTGTSQKDVAVSAVTNVQLNNGVTINAATASAVDLSFQASEAGSASYSISDGVQAPMTGTVVVIGSGLVTVSGLDVRTLNNGTLNLSVVFTDTLGNVAAAGTGSVLKDSVVPQTPQNVLLNGGVTINAATDQAVDITGTVAEAGTLLYALVDSSSNDVTGSLPVAGAGSFTVQDVDLSGLVDGTLTVYVTLTDLSGNVSLDANSTAQKDVVVQAAASVSLNNGAAINASTHTNVALRFNASESGSAQYVISDGTNTVSAVVAVSGAGTTTVSNLNVSSLADGILNISVVFTDTAGNAATAGTATVQKDATVPQAPQSVLLNGGVTILQNTQASVALTGTVGEAGMLEYVISDGTDNVTGTQAVSVGAFTISGIDVSGLDDGALNISVQVTDAAGNESSAGTSNVSKDTQISAVTNVQLNGGVIVNAATQTSVALTFNALESGSAIYTISDGSAPNVSGSVSVSGAGVTTVSGLNVSALDDGTLSLSVVFSDSAGNTASAATGSVQKDTQISAPQNIELNNQVTINAAVEDAVLLEGSVSEAGTIAYVISDGSSMVSDTEAVTSGNFSFAGVDVSGLSDGTLIVSVTLTDSAGNISATTQVGVLKDTVIANPTALIIQGGQSITFANQAAVSFAFSVNESGSLEYAFTDGTETVSDTVVVSSAGVQNVTGIDLSLLAEGAVTLTLRFQDDAGNTAGDVSGTVLKDTIAASPTNFVINGNQPINLANQSLVYFRATFPEAGTIAYEFSDTVHTVTGNGVISSPGVVTISNIDLATMNEGTISGNLTFTDGLGNVSLTVVNTITKDTLVNSAAQVILNAGATIDGDSASSVTLSFIVTEVGTVNYVITDENNNSVSGTFPVTSIGLVTISGIDVSGLANGFLTPTIAFVDQAGNQALSVQGAPIAKTDEILPDEGGNRRRRLNTNLEETVASGGGGGGGSSSSLPAGTSSGSVLSESVTRAPEEVPSDDEELMLEDAVVLPFVDLSEDDEEYEAVRYLYGRGIVRGQGSSTRFDSAGVVDWAQALKILLLTSGQEIVPEVGEAPFPDVEVSAWFAPYFVLAKKLGYVRGGPNGRVIPWQAMNRAEAVVLTYRVFGVRPDAVDQSALADVETGVWFSDALHDAVQRGVFSTKKEKDGTYADPTALITRAEFVRLIVEVWGNE